MGVNLLELTMHSPWHVVSRLMLMGTDCVSTSSGIGIGSGSGSRTRVKIVHIREVVHCPQKLLGCLSTILLPGVIVRGAMISTQFPLNVSKCAK